MFFRNNSRINTNGAVEKWNYSWWGPLKVEFRQDSMRRQQYSSMKSTVCAAGEARRLSTKHPGAWSQSFSSRWMVSYMLSLLFYCLGIIAPVSRPNKLLHSGRSMFQLQIPLTVVVKCARAMFSRWLVLWKPFWKRLSRLQRIFPSCSSRVFRSLLDIICASLHCPCFSLLVLSFTITLS